MPKPVSEETTDSALFVRTSAEGMVDFSRERIVEALVRETLLDQETAGLIGREVEEQIRAFHTRTLTAPLIRELVDAKLLEHGLEGARRLHTRLGMPLYDVEQLLLSPNKENANIPHGPEATNLTLAENIKKEYALLRVFSPEVADAHTRGDLHLHDLGFIDRPYCSGQSLEYVKKFGLNFPHALSIAKPARHPEVLLAHMVKFSAALQSHFAGAIGWDAVNVFFAPFLVGLPDREVRQLAQILIYEYSQQAVARGGQAIFSDINLYWETPKHFETVPAIGPGGVYTGKTYADYLPEAQRFVKALFEVYLGGDGAGRPFFFPKPLVHITEKLFRTPGHEEFLDLICTVAAEKGNTYFVFDRGETAKISECCRLSFKLEKSDLEDAREPWRMRYSALQNVTLNLPRAAYEAAGDSTKLFARLTELMETATQAHVEKRAFLHAAARDGRARAARAADDGPRRPALPADAPRDAPDRHGRPQRAGPGAHRARRCTSRTTALRFGLRVIAHLQLVGKKIGDRRGMRFVLEQTPAESTAYRFARLDLRYHPGPAGYHVKGDAARGEVYYTNSTYLNVQAPINPIERVKREGLFHPLIEAGSLSHIWLGESRPSAGSLADFVVKTFRNTQNDQIAFSPEFTSCNACQRTCRGLQPLCPSCGSDEVDGITRITGYFTRVSSWNKGKRGELTDRYRSSAHYEA